MNLNIKSSASFDKNLAEDNIAAFNDSVSKVCLENVEFTDERVSQLGGIVYKLECLEALEVDGTCRKRKQNGNLNHPCEVPLDGLVKILGALSQLSHLRILRIKSHYLGGARIEILLPIIVGIQTLELLDISANNIGMEGLIAVGESLASMPSLRKLRMEQNSILQNTIHIGDLVKHLTAWKALDCFRKTEGRTLKVDNDVIAALDLVASIVETHSLDLSEMNLAEDAMISLMAMLPNLDQLKTLNLTGNTLSDTSMRVLALSLERMTGLRELHLHSNGIDGDAAVTLARTVPKMTQIKTLSLRDNNIGVEGAVALAPTIGAMIQLQSLSLEDNGVEKSSATICFVLKNLTAFQSLQRFRDAEGTELDADDGFHEILDVVAAVVEKHTLGLSSWGLRDAGMSVLAPFLAKLDTLEGLDLSWNHLSDSGAVILSQCLTSLSHLRILNLDGNSIGADGVRSLATVLPQCHGLEELNLSRCRFGVEGAEVLSECLKAMPHLKMLRVGSNVYPFLELPMNVSQHTARFLGQRSDIAWRLIMGEMLKQDDNISSLFPLANTCQRLSAVVSSFVSELATVGLSIEGSQQIQEVPKIISVFRTITRVRIGMGYGYWDCWREEHLDILASMLEQSPSLEELLLYGSAVLDWEEGWYTAGIGEKGLQVLIANAEKLKFLQKLSLVECWEEISFGELAPVLEKMIQLRSLNLTGNRVGPDGAKELESVLLKMTQLTQLHLIDVGGVASVLGKMTQLQQLTLVETHWEGEAEATALKQMTHLKQLYFMGNFVRYRPENIRYSGLFPALGEMVQLQELWLNDNGFKSEEIIVLASALGKLTQLQKLGLGVSYIIEEAAEGLPSALERALERMIEHSKHCWYVNHIGAQGATALVSALSNMMELKELYLYGNEIGDEGIAVLAPVFGRMAKLQKLSLGWNSIGDEGAAVLAPVFGRMTQLLKLDLSENNIGIAGAAALAPVLAFMTKLQTLNLSGNRIETENATLSFAKEHLQEVQALQRFRDAARGNLIADGDFDDILNAVAAENEMDERFDFSSDEVETSAMRVFNVEDCCIGKEEAEELALQLEEMNELEVLNFCTNGAEVEEIATLAPALGKLTQLKELNLEGNDLGPEAVSALAPALGKMTKLQTLDLGGNQIDYGKEKIVCRQRCIGGGGNPKVPSNDIGAKGAAFLAPALKKLTQLTELNLANNLIEADGARALAPALAMMTQLKVLNLAVNDLGPEGARALAPALAMMTQLKVLNLAVNDLGPEGASALAPALAMMTQLKVLNLAGNDLGCVGAEVLNPVLQTMIRLKELDLSNNDIDIAEELEPALLKMTQLKKLNRYGNYGGEQQDMKLRLLERIIWRRGGNFR